MNGIVRLTNRLDQTASFMKSAIDALFLAVVLVVLACLVGLVVAGTFGILHNGDDFDFDLGGGGAGSSDVVVPFGTGPNP